jgi:cation transport ATPase
MTNAWEPEETHTDKISKEEANATTRTAGSSAAPAAAVTAATTAPNDPNAPVVNRPSWKRGVMRILQLITSVGALGFLAGATPYSGRDNPFDSKTIFPFLYVVGAVSILAALFFVTFFLIRAVYPKKKKLNRFLVFFIDIVLALAWGVLMVFMIAKYPCAVGANNGWCDFFNTSIFFAVASFVLFALSAFWDMFGSCFGSAGCCCRGSDEASVQRH